MGGLICACGHVTIQAPALAVTFRERVVRGRCSGPLIRTHFLGLDANQLALTNGLLARRGVEMGGGFTPNVLQSLKHALVLLHDIAVAFLTMSHRMGLLACEEKKV